MPANDVYWSSTEIDSDDPHLSRKSYIDPWDIENYIYIRHHLESVEPSSIQSSEDYQLKSSSTLSYIPENVRRPTKFFHLDSFDAGEISNYAAIDEVEERTNDAKRRRQSEAPCRRSANRDDGTALNRNNSKYILNHSEKVDQYSSFSSGNRRTRSYSYSCGDCSYELVNTSSETNEQNGQNQNEATCSPIYDDIKSTPKNFSLNNYGHLKIDYSYSWNNLNRYIYK